MKLNQIFGYLMSFLLRYAVFKVQFDCFTSHQKPKPCFDLSSLVKRCFLKCSGSHLLSHAVSSRVPSAAWVLTVVFGMGTGVSPKRIATGTFLFTFRSCPLPQARVRFASSRSRQGSYAVLTALTEKQASFLFCFRVQSCARTP